MKNAKKLAALLLALMMLFAFCACGSKSSSQSDDSTESANDPEAIAEKYVKLACEMDIVALSDLCVFDYEAFLKELILSDYDDEEEFFEEISEEYGQDIDSWKDAFAAETAEEKEYLADEYGDDYTIQAKAIDSVELDEDELADVKNDLLEDWNSYINTSKVESISKGMEITVEVTIEGEYDKDTVTHSVIVVKCDGKWKVTTNFLFEWVETSKGEKTDTATTATAPTTTQTKPSATQPTVTPSTISLGSWVYGDVAITFTFDGTGSLSDSSESMDFTWKYQNGYLILVDEYGDETAVRYTVDGNNLTLINGNGETLVFTKKTASATQLTAATLKGKWVATLDVEALTYLMGEEVAIFDELGINLGKCTMDITFTNNTATLHADGMLDWYVDVMEKVLDWCSDGDNMLEYLATLWSAEYGVEYTAQDIEEMLAEEGVNIDDLMDEYFSEMNVDAMVDELAGEIKDETTTYELDGNKLIFDNGDSSWTFSYSNGKIYILSIEGDGLPVELDRGDFVLEKK